jgi:glucokinase
MSIVLAGDVGGTKTLVGLFDQTVGRPRALVTRAFGTLEHRDLSSMIAMLVENASSLGGATIERASFGVAGPVVAGTAELTNVGWRVSAAEVAERCGIARVALINDLEAMAYAIEVLGEDELHVLQAGTPAAGGNVALIAAGTGLGQALLHRIDGRLVPSPTEAGHADFAARTEREIDLVRDLTRRYGRAEVEHVVSGRGLINLHRITHGNGCALVEVDDNPDAPAVITAAGLGRHCSGCVEALDMFVAAYGAESGNLALRTMATGGVYIGGGIAPKILPALADGRFMRAFLAKIPMDKLLASVPVKVILNPDAGLLGAAVHATRA